MKKALILSGGSTDTEQLQQEVRLLREAGGLLIVADSGLEALKELVKAEENAERERNTERSTKGNAGKNSYLPDYAVGDFDSVSPETLDFFSRYGGIQWERHRPEKNESDTELAFTIAREAGVTDLILLGVTGTRLDHVLANIHLLKTAWNLGMGCMLLDAHNRIRLVTGRTVFTKKESPYTYVSFVPLTEEVTHITLTGFKYPLKDYHMRLGVECGLCISNEIAEEQAILEFEQGLLLAIESKD